MIYLVTNQKRIEDEIPVVTPERCLAFINSLEEIALDTETTGFDPHTGKLLTLQVGNERHQYVIDATTVDISFLKEQLEGKTVIAHNFQFDGRWLLKHGINPTRVYDTFLVECVLNTGYDFKDKGSVYYAPTSLKDVAWKYCGAELDKSVRGLIHQEKLSNRVITYAARDVKYLHAIKEAQLEQVEELHLGKIVNLENDVVRVFTRMCYHGIPINIDKWKEAALVTANNTKELETKLDDEIFHRDNPALEKYKVRWIQGNLFFDDPVRRTRVNWSSPSQKQEILAAIGFPLDSVGEKELQNLALKDPLIPLLIEYAHQSKLSTAFGMDFLKKVNPVTRRIHPEIWQILSTGRISVSNPNVNQIPSKGKIAKAIRNAFEAPAGYKIVGGDYSNFEARIAAEFSQDEVWCDIFKEGKDLHSELCANTFNIPLDKVRDPFPIKPDISYRDVQKTINFGTIYQMGPNKLASTIQVPVEHARKLLEDFYASVPTLSEFLNKLKSLGRTRGFIKTKFFGRIRWFPQHSKAIEQEDIVEIGKIERASCNSPIQGGNADCIKSCLIELQDIIDTRKLDVQILLSVYDEIQCLVREDLAEEWARIQEEVMIKHARLIVKTIPVLVDVKISNCWTK